MDESTGMCHFMVRCCCSYLVCVDVSGAVAPSAIVVTKITQKPPRQTREVPLVKGNVQFGTFAGRARQAFNRL